MHRQSIQQLYSERNPLQPSYSEWPIQAGMRGDPWRVTVCCILLNRTTGQQVRPRLKGIFAMWPTATIMAESTVLDLYESVWPLGFGTKRGELLVRFSKEFLYGTWTQFSQLPGVGDYCRDSIRIFCYGETDFGPSDHVLAEYLGKQVGP